ncbi:leucine-rich repeat domain-containing protein [Haliea sp.]|uniref:leucine-rich repeat domain-containing protein n=1 Tax=Haliea sp. TaxID=1932666 RepID=UPI003529CB3E
MTQDVLARTRSHEVSQARFKLGDYEFREPDYQQILRWAEALGMAPEALLNVLEDSKCREATPEEQRFVVKDGAITSLVWDLDRLKDAPGIWGRGLMIRELYVRGEWPDNISTWYPILPYLQVLEIPVKTSKDDLLSLLSAPNRLTELDLSAVPELTFLSCARNQLRELNLSPVPKLTELYCDGNQLSELDLSAVAELQFLFCASNQLTQLDLSAVPELEALGCNHNQLTELDLSAVPKLDAFDCETNQLTELDLSAVPELGLLYCNHNQLTELDLSPVPKLFELDCRNNELSELDLFPVPTIRKLRCDGGVKIINAPREFVLNGGTVVSYADEGPDKVLNSPDTVPF